MTKLFYSLVIVSLTLISAAGTFVAKAQSLPMSDTAQANFVTVDVAIGEREMFVRYKVPIIARSGRNNFVDQSIGGCYSVTAACDKHIGCEYCVFLIAERVANDRVMVTVSSQYRGKAHFSEIRLNRGKPSDKKLKDGVRVKAYYGLQPPVKN